ncbi:MAG: ABC-2 type transporter [candidate division BRC1 bacterium ADurb.BinA364]|nr:MAG: ABC-2 type transporter [candidate division BRC1 bacterium ADurb.BinA364]
MSERPRIVYTAETGTHHFRAAIGDMLRGARGAWYMGYRLFLKDMRADYARSALGFAWDFLDPLVLAGIFYMLARNSIIAPGEMEMPVAVFMIYGMLLYQTFCEAATLSVDAIRRSGAMLNQLKIPPEAILYSVLCRLLFNSLFRLPVMLLFSLSLMPRAAADGLSSFSPGGFLAFLALYPAVILPGMAIGLALAPLNTIYHDIGRLVRIVLVPLRFFSPVLYKTPQIGVFSWFGAVNPIAMTLTNLRLLAATGGVIQPLEWALLLSGFALLFLLGWFVFHISIPVLAERA